MPGVSAVVLGYNRRKEVLYTVSKLKELKQALPFELEIIVVDNGSIDDTSAVVKSIHRDITLITKAVNNGIAGWNEGFKAAKNKYLLVLDDDSHIENGLPEAVAFLDNNPEVGILALNVTTGPFITENMNWRDNEELIGFFGCGAIIRKAVYDKIGGFAEWLHVYSHEFEYGIRTLDAGYRIRYFQNSNVIHRASTANRSFRRVRIYSTRNEMAIVYKYFGHDRWKHLFRMWGNAMKRIKNVGFKYTYYEFIGSLKFFLMARNIEHTPVSRATQDFFATQYVSSHPVFGFVTKWLKKLVGVRSDNQDKLKTTAQ